MSPAKKVHSFHPKITNSMIGRIVRTALRQEYADVSAALRHIARTTGISYSTVSKWYKCEYTPQSSHLLTLAAHYPSVLQGVCELIGIGGIWQEIVRTGAVKNMQTHLNKKSKKSSMKLDKFVHIYVRLDAHMAIQMNQRQLWFLGELQQGYRMKTADLVDTWHVHSKTAKRDVTGLLEAKLIAPLKTDRNTFYELL